MHEAKDHDASTNDEASKEQESSSSILARTAAIGKAALEVVHEAGKAETDKLKDKSVKDALKAIEEEQRDNIHDDVQAAKNFTTAHLGTDTGDEVLPHVDSDRARTPDITYGHGKCGAPLPLIDAHCTLDMVFDTEGYHSRAHDKQTSDSTITHGESIRASEPTSADRTPGPSRKSR